MPAKPIIDIMLAVDNYSRAYNYAQVLGQLDYLNFGECGKKGRTFLVEEKNDKSLFHLHLVVIGIYTDYINQNLLKKYLN